VSVRFHLGQVHLGIVAVEIELGLDTEDNPAAVDQLLYFGGPAVVDEAARVFADVVVVDIAMHQDARLDTDFGRLAVTQSVLDHFLSILHCRFLQIDAPK